MGLRRQLALSLLLLCIVIMGAVVGYRWLGGPGVSFLDALYMAVVTVATVGYSEFVSTAGNPALRVFNIFVILFGIGIMLYVFSASTAFIVEGELEGIFRRRKMLKQIRDLQGHFIVCGAGETAHHVVKELLKCGHSVVVIDHEPDRLEKIRNLGDFPVLPGDAADEEVLTSAGLSKAQGLVSVLPEDKDNLLVTVTVRQLNTKVRIVARCIDAKMIDKLVRAGANAAVSPNMIGGMRLASELIRPNVVNFLDMMLRDTVKTMRVEEIRLEQGSPWAGKTLAQTELHKRYEMLVLAMRRADGGLTYNPSADWILAEGDVIVVLGDVNNAWKARAAAGQAVPPQAES